jgi:hypothetical protein
MLSRGGAVICGVGHAQYQLLLRFGIGILCGCFHCALAFSCWLPRQLTGNGSSLWAVFFLVDITSDSFMGHLPKTFQDSSSVR